MSLDIIEIALDKLTDDTDFEKLSSEIMELEGYTNIKPLGIVSDSGRDAIQESYFASYGKVVTIFQYTLQEYLPSKIDNTIEKLKEAKIDFQELVIVNPHDISAQRQDQMKRDTRIKHGVTLLIYERKTIIARLAVLENGLFHRHFPDIEKQLQDISAQKLFLTSSDPNALESALLRSSLCFAMSKDAPKARHSIFDSLIFGIVINHPKDGISIKNILDECKRSFQITPSGDQVSASLNRLVVKTLLKLDNGIATPTKTAIESTSGAAIRTNEATQSLMVDIIQQMNSITGTKLLVAQISIVKRNAANTLMKLFRFFGIELSSQVLKDVVPTYDYITNSKDLADTVRKDLPKELGTLLADIISQIITKPSEEQAIVLSNWSLAYLGVQIMNLDPSLKELQVTRISNKVFILDTDFILDCIVKENPWSITYIKLITTLRKYGCRVIVPEKCVEECITHAEISHRTYHHFGIKLLAMSEEYMEETVGNMFVKGFYHARNNRLISPDTSFETFLLNYYEPKDSKRFMLNVIKSTFPQGVEVNKLDDLLTEELSDKAIKQLTDSILGIISGSLKSKYRSKEEMQKLAETDARLFLTTVQLNSTGEVNKQEILGGCCYVITASNKYIRAAKDVGSKDVVTTRPKSLISILEIIGGIQVSPEELIKLFDNPLLSDAVENTWDDVEKLLDNGIQLRDKSIPRLRWDLDQELHGKLVAFEEADKPEAPEIDDTQPTAGYNEFTELIKSASSRGYNSIPELQYFISILDNKDTKIKFKNEEYAQLLDRFAMLEQQITYFGKRRQKYLKKIAQKKEPDSK